MTTAQYAVTLGVGLRVGERRFALRSLLAEDPAAVLDALAREARAQAPAVAAARWLDELAALAALARAGR